MGAGVAGELTPTRGERSMVALIQIGEFRPDLPEFGTDGATVALNVVPAASSYRPLASLSPYSDALSSRCQGAFATRDSGGNVHNSAVDAGKLSAMEIGRA